MAATPSTMLPLGATLPSFSLPDYDGRAFTTADRASAPALLVAFLCPHCPFVRHIRHELARFAEDYRPLGLDTIAINSNDPVAYPSDDAAGMKLEAEEGGYTFPYLVDEDQSVAKAFRAACTPDFYLFDAARRLVYRGQFDDSRPSSPTPVTGVSLRAAVDALLAERAVDADQRPSVGCSIKWKAGHDLVI